MYLCAADEAGSVPDVFRVLVSLLTPRSASERAINEVMSTLAGASESDDPRSSAPWHVLLRIPLSMRQLQAPEAALLTDGMNNSLDLLHGVAQPQSCCRNATASTH